MSSRPLSNVDRLERTLDRLFPLFADVFEVKSWGRDWSLGGPATAFLGPSGTLHLSEEDAAVLLTLADSPLQLRADDEQAAAGLRRVLLASAASLGPWDPDAWEMKLSPVTALDRSFLDAVTAAAVAFRLDSLLPALGWADLPPHFAAQLRDLSGNPLGTLCLALLSELQEYPVLPALLCASGCELGLRAAALQTGDREQLSRQDLDARIEAALHLFEQAWQRSLLAADGGNPAAQAGREIARLLRL